MQIKFNVQVQVVREPARPGGKRRRLRTLGVLAVLPLVLFVPMALASDTFTDVPSTHPFHNQIERAYAAGMIGACAGSPPPPNQTFCPGNNITKGSAANQYDKAFGLDGTPRPFTPTWRQVNVVTGGSTAPFTVDSTQKVLNLNSDLLDGLTAADFAPASHNHDDRYYTKSQLSTPGTLNDPANPVDWSNLKNVPAGFADGVDNTGSGTYAAGEGLSLTGNTFSADFGPGHSQVARGDHDHFGQTWTGSAQSGLVVTNTSTTGTCGSAAIEGVGAAPSGVTGCSPTGVFGDSHDGYGVFGSSSNGTGLYGRSTTGVGVYGYSGTGQAGYFGGDVRVTGNLQLDGSGVVKSVGAGTGLTSSGPQSTPTLAVDSSYQLPQGCAAGSSPKYTSGGNWDCGPAPLSLFADSRTAATTYITGSCTNYSGGAVTVNVPSPGGTVIVDAHAWLKLNHLVNTYDTVYAYVGTVANDCADFYFRDALTVGPADPNDGNRDVTVAPRGIFENQSPGPHTYYLNAQMASGADGADRFWFGGMTAQVLPNG
jgi:hypothetical protein